MFVEVVLLTVYASGGVHRSVEVFKEVVVFSMYPSECVHTSQVCSACCVYGLDFSLNVRSSDLPHCLDKRLYSQIDSTSNALYA